MVGRWTGVGDNEEKTFKKTRQTSAKLTFIQVVVFGP